MNVARDRRALFQKFRTAMICLELACSHPSIINLQRYILHVHIHIGVSLVYLLQCCHTSDGHVFSVRLCRYNPFWCKLCIYRLDTVLRSVQINRINNGHVDGIQSKVYIYPFVYPSQSSFGRTEDRYIYIYGSGSSEVHMSYDNIISIYRYVI